ncbi:hypothetical protein K7472_05575 [Streptomyces sp. PTM05]|uniref:Uncharacterized protein n=1 Tax=Streptantibioticus parmotrematis TaxID=2873249 RepID=A0ABS7QMA2_9ACTN|nr:hypothetical protein [Streptantibioticus parmotrematis]MBY8884318.1 hypothetical protein [Streptantibioticus parmotrematis]
MRPIDDEPGDLQPPDAERVDPEVLTALLRRHGWERRGRQDGPYTRWTPPGHPYAAGSAAGTSVLVPARGGFGDSADLLGEALTALARSGAPSAREVLLALSVPGDEVRWRRDVPRTAGAVPWTAAEQLRQAVRGTLLAAARAARAPSGYFGERHARHAHACLEQVLLGPAASGHLLTAYLPAPGARAVTVTLLRALQATRDAVDYQRTTGRWDAFDAAVELGVCHELVVALAHLVRESEGAEIALAWSPAAGTPPGVAARPEPVEFSPGDLPALHRAASRYVRAEPPVRVTVTGTVVRLRSARPSGGGTVRLRVLSGAEVRQVRVRLDEDGYRAAVEAHLAGRPVRLSGALESRDGFRRLIGASVPVPVDLDEAERDRLLKAWDEPARDDERDA